MSRLKLFSWLTLLLLILSPSSAKSTDLSLAALETYAASAAKNTDHRTLTDSDAIEASGFGMYLRGFLNGIAMGAFVYRREDEDNKVHGNVTEAPAWMNDPASAAPSILAFIRRHCPPGADKNKIAASAVLLAWYVFEHPKAQMGERIGGFLCLKDVCGWGANFPDAEHLMHKMGENFTEEKEVIDKSKTKKSESLPESPEVYHLDLGSVLVDLPKIPDLFRIDGRMADIDESAKKMAESLGNRPCLILGTAGDDADISAGRFPSMERTIAIQQRLTPSLVTLKDFDALRATLTTKIKENFPEAGQVLDKLGHATESALQGIVDSNAKASLGKPRFLGIIEQDDHSIVHSMLLPMTARVAGKQKNIPTVTTIAIIYLQGTVVSISATAKYEKPSDLDWTVSYAKLVRDKMLFKH